MTGTSRRKQSRTIQEYTRTIKSEGISVRTKCYRVTEGRRERYEVLLDAAGQRATVDVDDGNPTRVNKIVEVAARGFAASLALQLGDSKRL